VSRLRASYSGLAGNVRGALWILASAITFTLMTALVKFLGDDYSPALQTFYRQAAGVLVLLPLIWRNPRGALHATRYGVLLYRALASTLGMVLAFYAYQEMPLAEANALSFTRTLWIVPLAIFVLHERIGAWRLGAALVGFLGVLIMLQPSIANAVGWPAAAALASALLFATTVTGVKMLTRDHSVTVLMVWSALMGFVLSIPLALLEWRWPTPSDLALLAAMGVLGLLTQTCYIKGMSLGDAAAMAPIDYTRLVFALLFGFLIFHETPDGLVMVGALIVIGSTLVITMRELRLRRPPSPERAE
jgi:drug/metabolite transporter (DMT)-like permease